MTEIKLYNSRIKLIPYLVGSAAFVCIGIFTLKGSRIEGSDRIMPWVSISFFGLCSVIYLYKMVSKNPQIIINELGIYSKSIHNKIINWEIIKDVYLITISRQKFICIVLPEGFDPSRKKGNLAKKISKFNKELGFQELNIPLGQIKIDEEKLMQFILAMSKANPMEKAEIIKMLPKM
jgi:hypothetical protein